jgi:hypothetical protein
MVPNVGLTFLQANCEPSSGPHYLDTQLLSQSSIPWTEFILFTPNSKLSGWFWVVSLSFGLTSSYQSPLILGHWSLHTIFFPIPVSSDPIQGCITSSQHYCKTVLTGLPIFSLYLF